MSDTPVLDSLSRPLGSLRISVTDRCNIRCSYCMPEDNYVWLPRSSILSFEELDRLVGVFTRLGVQKLRITGGEPLLRHNLQTLVQCFSNHSRVRDIALTTNGVLLAKAASALRGSGLSRFTVSLDTLRPERFLAFTRSSRHADVLEGIAAAERVGFKDTKLNMVVIRGFNDDEILEMLEFGRARSLEVRFIEYMDVGGATRWTMQQVFSRQEILARVEDRYGGVEPLESGDVTARRAPADRFALPDGTPFGIIASTTQPFCRRCDRSRITADGMWFLCLYAPSGIDLKELMRSGSSDVELMEVIATAWRSRTDRGAELRVGVPDRDALYRVEGLRADPHREMHTRGG